jgi:hypothetical protein
MKKLIVVLGVVALLGVIPVAVLAQRISPDPQNSHILIQNLSTQQATVVVEVYNANTGNLQATDSFTIAGSGATTVHSTAGTNVPGHRYLNLPDGFQGSMVVSSDQPVVAVNVTVGGSDFTSHSAYESISPDYADTRVFMPSVHWRNAQWAMVGIQNTGSVAATARYTYFLQSGEVISSGTVVIQPGRSNVRDVATDININVHPAGVGSMLVTADQPIGVAVLETLQKYTEAYIGFPSWYGDTTIYLPSVHHRSDYMHASHILVQNLDPLTASLVITYYQQSGAVADVFTSTIPPNGSLTFHTTRELSSDGRSYEPIHLTQVGSAVIVSNRPLVAVNVEVLGSGSTAQPYAYNGFRSDAGGTTLLFPSVHANPGGQWSHILVQNLDAQHTNQVRLEYYRQDGGLDTVYTTTLPAAGALTFHTTGEVSTDGNRYAPGPGFGNVGAVKVISLDGRPLVGVNVETLRGLAAVYAGFKP